MQRAKHAEIAVCELFKPRVSIAPAPEFVIIISWLDDGRVWYGLMITLPVIYGKKGLLTGGSMVKVGLTNLAVYRLT